MSKPSPLCLAIALAFSTPLAVAGQTVAFNIPAQPLSDALLEFSQSSGMKVFFSSDDARNLSSRGLNGHYTPTQGLQKLLAGTPLVAQNTGAATVTLAKSQVTTTAPSAETTPPVLPTVTVTGNAYADNDPYNPAYNRTEAATATKTDTPIMETPYAIKVIPRQVMEDQQATRLEKALQNVSGVTREPAGNLAYESFNVRGFQSWLTYRDGLRLNDLSSPRETANLERVEVLKGPGSILYGRSDPGGIINQVTKQPLATPYYALQQQFGSFDYYRTTLDATGPVLANDNLLYRFNMAYEDAQSFKPFKDSDHIFVAPVLKWQISPSTQIGLELEYLDNSVPSDVGIPAINGRPANIPRNRNLSQPWARFNNQYTLVGLNWSHAFNNDWTLRHRFNTQLSSGDSMTIGRNSTKSDGTNYQDYQWYSAQTQDMETYFNTLELTGKFDTWGARHTLLMGGDYYRLDDRVKYIEPFNSKGDYDELVVNIDKPQYTAKPPTSVVWETSYGSSRIDWYGLFIQDQIELPFHLHGLVGIRYDNATTTDNLAKTSYDDDKVSTRGGLLWRPIPEWSLYGSYTENFGLANSAYNAHNQLLPPQIAEQWETGMKTELWDGRFTASLAWFELTKQNLPALDPNYKGLGQRYIAIGEIQSRGLELDLAGEVLPGWRVIGAYTYMPSVDVIKDFNRDDQGGVNYGNLGKRNPNAPRNSGSLWTTYAWQDGGLKGLSLGAGVVAVGERQVQLAAADKMPGYAIMNLLASYRWNVGGAKATVQLNVDNLLDKTYYSGSNGGLNIHFGAPRTFMGLVKLEY